MKVFTPIRWIAVAAWAISAATASANPTGASVVNGQVTINTAGNLLAITNSPNSIINWQSFSIGANEITRFLQQSGNSAVLNRVIGAGGAIDPSVILGALQSNGRVFLINPSGIVFGVGSQIDVAGLVASSLNLSNADFLGGRLNFTAVPGAGAVVNQGTINAASGGQVYLVGPAVTNSGIITSPQGEVILAAGNSVELVNPGTPNLRVEISAPNNEAVNLGSIVAASGRIGIYAGLVKSTGNLNADRAVVGPAGEILLKATASVVVGGTITALGGSITVDAADIISESAVILQAGLATLSGPICPASAPACGTVFPSSPPLLISTNPGQDLGPIDITSGNIVLNNGGGLTLTGSLTLTGGNFGANAGGGQGGSISVSGGQLVVTGNNTPGGNGNVTLVAGSGTTNTTPGSVTVNVTGGTLSTNNVAVPLTALSGSGPVTLQSTTNLVTLLPAGQAVVRGTAQITGSMSTISQVNDFTRSIGGAAFHTLTPPRTSLVFEQGR